VDTGSIIAICVSGGSLAIAGGSLALSVRADRRAGRVERRGRQATPIVKSLGAGRDGEVVTHDYLVHNDGPATITYVMVWIVDHKEEPLSTSDSADVVLTPGDEVRLRPRIVNPERLGPVLWIRWRDPDGEHEKPTDVLVPPLV
jgi:hypothetical protein